MKKIFVSYSHDSEEHKSWVNDLVVSLRQKNYDIQFDQTDLKAGHDLVRFTERGVTESDYVITVCTDKYNAKADNGHVGYEKMIITSEILANQSTEKFIPIIRNVSNERKTPVCLSTRLYIDFSEDNLFNEKLIELTDALGFPVAPESTGSKLKEDSGWSFDKHGEHKLKKGDSKEILFDDGSKEKYLLIENDILCVEQTFPNGVVSYYEVDKDGNIVNQKFPYTVSEYKLVVNEESVVSKKVASNIDGNIVNVIDIIL